MESLYLICTIAGQRIALPAEQIESVVEIEGITPVPLVAHHVAGLFALRSRVLTIIDSMAALDLGPMPAGEALQAVIVAWEGHAYGLLVDDVLDVLACPGPARPVRAALSGGWARAATGVVDYDGDAVLRIDPTILIEGSCAIAA